MTTEKAAPVVDVVRTVDGRIHLARTVATTTDCGLVDVQLDTTVTVSAFEESDPSAYCQRCFPDTRTDCE